jgi:hypothetical protein
MLSPEPLRGLDLMTQSKYHRTNISLQLSKNNVRSLPPSPRPYGRFRANGSHQPLAADGAPWYGEKNSPRRGS